MTYELNEKTGVYEGYDNCDTGHMTALIRALESGKYPQARGALRTADGFCCAGVAGDLAAQAGVCEWKAGNRDAGDSWYMLTDPDGRASDMVMTPAVIAWLGIGHLSFPENLPVAVVMVTDPLTDGADPTQFGTMANDHEHTFPQIAQALRDRYDIRD